MEIKSKGIAACPYCNKQITNVLIDYLLQKESREGLVKKSNIVYLCPECHKVLSVSGMAG